MSGEALALTYLALAKWVTYLGLIGLTGAVVTRRIVLPHAGDEPAVQRRTDDTLRGIAIVAGVVAVLGAITRLYAQTYSVFGLDEPVTAELIYVVGVESRWARSFQPHAGLTVVAAAAALAIPRWPTAAWRVVLAATVLLWVTLPLTGHAMSWGMLDSHYLWMLQIGHGLGAGLWIGTLAAILVIASPLGHGTDGHRRFAELIDRFSPVAIRAVGLLLITGGLTAWFYIDALGQLVATPYGRVLLLKVGLVLATGAIGAYNWRRMTPRLGGAEGTAALVRSGRLEVACALLLLAATAVLVHLATPYELE